MKYEDIIINQYKAECHVKDMENKYHNEIIESINDTILYNPKNISKISNKRILFKHTYSLSIIDQTSSEAIFEFQKISNNIAVLNFANFVSPGGGFINGDIAQEECLCHNSNLYNVLSSDKITNVYYYPNYYSYTNNDLYIDRILYTPNIVFEKDNNVAKVNVITSAAPNAFRYIIWANDNNVSNYEDMLYTALESRIRSIIKVAISNNIDTLILGAFGCGAFGNDPNIVSKLFTKTIKKIAPYNNITHYIFAIPNNINSRNYEIFKSNLL